MAGTVHDFVATTIRGEAKNLSDFQGKVLLVVNTASRCGFTPQYEGLEAIYRRYKDQGLVVLGFPCNQFGSQEPGSSADIAGFCQMTYDITFPMFARIEVNGANAHPLYQYLKAEAPGLLGTQAIKWNFTKFLVDKQGKVLKRFAPNTEPVALAEDIEQALR